MPEKKQLTDKKNSSIHLRTELSLYLLQFQSLYRAFTDTFATFYTLSALRVFGRVHSHLTDLLTLTAGDALFLVTPDTYS